MKNVWKQLDDNMNVTRTCAPATSHIYHSRLRARTPLNAPLNVAHRTKKKRTWTSHRSFTIINFWFESDYTTPAGRLRPQTWRHAAHWTNNGHLRQKKFFLLTWKTWNKKEKNTETKFRKISSKSGNWIFLRASHYQSTKQRSRSTNNGHLRQDKTLLT